MAGTTRGYSLRSSKLENRVQDVIKYDESTVQVTHRSRDIKIDPSENTDDAQPHVPRGITPSAPNIPRPSLGMEGESAASSDARRKTHDARNRRDRGIAKDLDAIEAASLRRKALRYLIYHEKKQRRIRTEVWALKQRALDLDRRADEIDRWLRRMTRLNTQISDPESQSMDNKKDAMSQLSHTPSEVSSVSEVQAREQQ